MSHKRMKAYAHLYERVEVITPDGKSTMYIWTLRPNARGAWHHHLLPAHKAFFEQLDEWGKICVIMSADPFSALLFFYLKTKKVK